MDLATQFAIKNNPNLYRFLRENSYWYKELNRNPESIKQMEEKMKEYYKITPKDKMQELERKIELIRTFMEIMR